MFPSTRPEDIAVQPREDRDEGALEAFDRLAFVHAALELMHPAKMTIAICGGSTRLRVEAGRAWGRRAGERWAMVSVPDTASRRAIALAIAGLADADTLPYVLDVLLGHAP